jgi:spore germination protein YaaH
MKLIPKKACLLCILILSLFLIQAKNTETAAAAANNTPPHYTRLFYYQSGSAGYRSFLLHPGSIDIFAPQLYKLDSEGNLSGQIRSEMLKFALDRHIRVMPLVTNGNFSKNTAQALLDDPVKQDAAIKALIDEAKKDGFYGWQIDFEQIDASYKDKFSAFISKAYAAMKQEGLALSVAVIAKISDTPSDYPNNLWDPLIGVYDYGALSAHADFISVMSYDDPFSNGPVVEYSWLLKVLSYSMAHIPKEKISLGIPLYYWKWNDTTGEKLSSGGATSMQEIMKKYKTTKHYSTTEQAAYLTYKVNGQDIVLWYENEKSVAKKIGLVAKNQLYGFSAWTLGSELEEVYGAMK